MKKQVLVILLLFSISTESYAQGRFGIFSKLSKWIGGGDDVTKQVDRKGENGTTPSGNQADEGDGLVKKTVGEVTRNLGIR